MKTAEQIVSLIKWRKRLIVAAYILVALATFIFLGDTHFYNGLETFGVGLNLHPLIVVIVVLAEGVICVLFYSRTENVVERILTEECDPARYLAVKQSIMSRRSYVSDMIATDLNVSYFGGDFRTCLSFAEEAIHASGDPDKLQGYYFLGRCAYFLGDTKALDDAIKMSKRILERTKVGIRSPQRLAFDANIAAMEMLSFCVHGENEKALEFADSVVASSVTERSSNLDRANVAFLRGTVYERCGEKKKAQSAFEIASSLGGTTFISSGPIRERS